LSDLQIEKNHDEWRKFCAAVPRFDGHYDHWSMLMENFLRSKEYWSLVETGYEGQAVTYA